MEAIVRLVGERAAKKVLAAAIKTIEDEHRQRIGKPTKPDFFPLWLAADVQERTGCSDRAAILQFFPKKDYSRAVGRLHGMSLQQFKQACPIKPAQAEFSGVQFGPRRVQITSLFFWDITTA
jgi:hypothetical protein